MVLVGDGVGIIGTAQDGVGDILLLGGVAIILTMVTATLITHLEGAVALIIMETEEPLTAEII
jgi:hypothetical protein